MDSKKSPEEESESLNNITRKRKLSNVDQDSEDVCPAKKTCSPSKSEQESRRLILAKRARSPLPELQEQEDVSPAKKLCTTQQNENVHNIENSNPTQPPKVYGSLTRSREARLRAQIDYEAQVKEVFDSPPASVLASVLSSITSDLHAQSPSTWYKKKSFITPAADLRLCPLPAMSWAESQDVWKLMCRKDVQASLYRSPEMLNDHPGLQSRMRAILLDWLIEVCEVYKLHRETYYLAVDYLDRFLTDARNTVKKTHLQLVGITCLFIAAKVEEIYPPKIGEFAYVTDCACTEEDITFQELIILKALNWGISTITIMGWLSVYMQVNVTSRPPPLLQHTTTNLTTKNTDKIPNLNKNCDSFIYPQFSQLEFVHTAQLVDLCTLDIEMIYYPYSVIAAAAMSHTFNKKIAIAASGLEWEFIENCSKWMEPFFKVICEESPRLFLLETNEPFKTEHGLNHICPNITADESHIIQTHAISLNMFDKVLLKKEEYAESAVDTKFSEGLLTPPASSRKPTDIEQ